MARLNALTILLLVFVTSCSPRGVVKPSKIADRTVSNIARSIEDAIATTDPNVNIGISIKSLNTNKIIYEKNADRHFVPCSTLK